MYHWPGNCWWWRFPCPCSHTHIYIFMYILILMSNNLVNQSTKAISTNELRWIGPVLAVMSSGPMDLFLIMLSPLLLNITDSVYMILWWHLVSHSCFYFWIILHAQLQEQKFILVRHSIFLTWHLYTFWRTPNMTLFQDSVPYSRQ